MKSALAWAESQESHERTTPVSVCAVGECSGGAGYNFKVSTTSHLRSPAPTPEFTLRQRLALWFISWLGYLLISLIGCTLRFEYSSEPGGEVAGGDPPRVCHRSLLASLCDSGDVVLPRTWHGGDDQPQL